MWVEKNVQWDGHFARRNIDLSPYIEVVRLVYTFFLILHVSTSCMRTYTGLIRWVTNNGTKIKTSNRQIPNLDSYAIC